MYKDIKRNKKKQNTKYSHQSTEESKIKEEENPANNPKTVSKVEGSTYLSIVTLNVNGLNTPIKKHRMAQLIKKKKH